VAQLLIALRDSEEGRSLLLGIDTREFVTAKDQDFDVVRRFLNEYETKVKKLP
jgi:hypothetical protein